MLYIILASMALAASAAAVWPLLAKRRDRAPAASPVSVYRDQLAELEDDVGDGIVEATAQTRLELERRILAADAETKDADPATVTLLAAKPLRAVLAVVILIITLSGSAILYYNLGAPNYIDIQRQAAIAEADRAPWLAQLRGAIKVALARIENGEGTLRDWIGMGQAYGELGEFELAEAAYLGALELEPDNGMLYLAIGESKVLRSNGSVGQEAITYFEGAVERDPDLFGALFYLGLGRYQVGDLRGAYDQWLDIAKRSPPRAPWMDLVRQYLSETATELEIPLPELATAPEALPEARPEDSDPKMNATILQMVERLSTQLNQDGGSAEQWAMLGRSMTVLERFPEAKSAYARALAEDPASLDARLGLAEALVATEGLQEVTDAVIEAFEAVLAIDPSNSRSLYVTGIAYAARGNIEAARQNFEMLLQEMDASAPEYQDIKDRLNAL